MSKEISKKWPAARLIGPKVTEEQALEFIRRTDSAFEYCCTNDHQFATHFCNLIGDVDPPRGTPIENLHGKWAERDRFKDHFGFVRLAHLESNWIASSYIGGPNGPVSPYGDVMLARNFGKWPNLEEIEDDLENIAVEFPWLSFKLSLYDVDEVEYGMVPDFTWHLDKGRWGRIEPEVLPVSDQSMDVFMASILSGSRRETTWTIDEIEEMWGDKIRSALTAAKEEAQ